MRGNTDHLRDESIVKFDEAEINNALSEIELEMSLSPDHTACHGPFSVFCLKVKEETSSPGMEILMEISESESFHELGLQDNSFDNALQDDMLDSFTFPDWAPKTGELEIGFSSPASPGVLSHSEDILSALSLPEERYSPSTSDDFTSYLSRSLSNMSSPRVVESRCPSLMESNIFNRSFERIFMTPDVRFLLGHYMNHVIDIMTVVSNTKSPWKSLHLPRALQGCGELEAVGTTCNARNALINALLSISAFNLAQKHKGNQNSTEADKWNKSAQKYRFRAVNLLKVCLEEDFSAGSKVRYKEILAAMLSMVTIDVSSGFLSLLYEANIDGMIGYFW
jgi:hypothetical protein